MENHSRRMAHGDPRPARTPSSREQRSSFLGYFYQKDGTRRPTTRTHTIITRAAIVASVFFYQLLTSLVFVELVELYTLHGERPPAIFNFQARHGRRSCAATCQITREDGAIIDICMVVFGSIIALFSLHARGSSL